MITRFENACQVTVIFAGGEMAFVAGVQSVEFGEGELVLKNLAGTVVCQAWNPVGWHK